jgi:hypothetical protein
MQMLAYNDAFAGSCIRLSMYEEHRVADYVEPPCQDCRPKDQSRLLCLCESAAPEVVYFE